MENSTLRTDVIQREEICYRHRAPTCDEDKQRGGIALDDNWGNPLKRVEEMKWSMSDLSKAVVGEKAGPNERIEAFPLRNPTSSVKMDGAQAEGGAATKKPELKELQNDPGFEFKSKKKRANLERMMTNRKNKASAAAEEDMEDTGHATFAMTLTGVEKSLLKLEQLELDIK